MSLVELFLGMIFAGMIVEMRHISNEGRFIIHYRSLAEMYAHAYSRALAKVIA